LFYTEASKERRQALEAAGARVHRVESGGQGGVSIDAVLRELAELEVNDVYAECGARLAGALLAGQHVDEMDLFLGPHLLGPAAKPMAAVDAVAGIPDPPAWRTVAAQRVGRDTRIRLQPGRD